MGIGEIGLGGCFCVTIAVGQIRLIPVWPRRWNWDLGNGPLDFCLVDIIKWMA